MNTASKGKWNVEFKEQNTHLDWTPNQPGSVLKRTGIQPCGGTGH